MFPIFVTHLAGSATGIKIPSFKDSTLTILAIVFKRILPTLETSLDDGLNGKANVNFYDFDAKAVQGKRQYETTYSYDVDYPNIKSTILPGIEENGVVLFEPLDYKTQTVAKFQFEGTRADTYSTFSFIFFVNIPK
jgi:hypothetical protein